MNTTYTKRFGTAVMIAVLAGAAGSAVATEPNTTDADLLRGPEVVDASGPDSGDTMSRSKGNKGKATGDLPFRAYMGAIRGLARAAQENPELALTDEQKEELKVIGKAHKEKMNAFMEEHKEEIAELRGKHGKRGEHKKRGQKGQRDKKADQDDTQQSESDAQNGQQRQGAGKHAEHGEGNRPSPELRQKMRKRMAELMATAPSDHEAKKQLWAVLTPAQQDAVKKNIAEMRKKHQQRIDGAMERGRKGKEDKKGKGKKSKERKGDPQGMINNPIFEIDNVVEISDDC